MFFMRIKSIKSIKSAKSTKRQTSDFLLLRCFYAHKNAVFLVSHSKKHKKHKNHKDTNLFVWRFVLLVRVKFFCKKIKRFKIALIPSFTILLTCTLLDSPIENLFVRIHFYLSSSVRISSIYENLFESLLIYDHLWESFLFMRIFWISSYLWSSVRISSFYENLFESLLIYDHLWESLLIYDQLFYYLFFITLTHLCVLILIFFYHSKSILICMHSSWSVRIENLHEHK